jgi:DNA-binding protein H-NS
MANVRMETMVDSLAALDDDGLRAVIARAETLLKERDEDRKAKAMEQARTLLASVGLSLKDLNGKGKKAAKGIVYRKGVTYQHPTNKALVYGGHGKKPHWLSELEAEGGKAIEIVNDNAPVSLKKTIQ